MPRVSIGMLVECTPETVGIPYTNQPIHCPVEAGIGIVINILAADLDSREVMKLNIKNKTPNLEITWAEVLIYGKKIVYHITELENLK